MENIARYISGLETELEYAEARGDIDQAKAVKAELASARKRLKKAETAVADDEETPEPDDSAGEKAVVEPPETPESKPTGKKR